jgi:hypothetical protein
MEYQVKAYDGKKIDELPIVNTDEPSKKYDPKEEKFLREYVICEFNNIEQPNLTQSFTYGNTKKCATFNFWHGGKYKLPRHVMMHINRCGTPMYNYKPDTYGKMKKAYTGKKNRFMMQQIG